MLYDVRFETGDVIHRIFKFAQLLLLGILLPPSLFFALLIMSRLCRLRRSFRCLLRLPLRLRPRIRQHRHSLHNPSIRFHRLPRNDNNLLYIPNSNGTAIHAPLLLRPNEKLPRFKSIFGSNCRSIGFCGNVVGELFYGGR
jgi:hypothetical protein